MEEKWFSISLPVVVTTGQGEDGRRGATMLGWADAGLAGWPWVELGSVAQASINYVSNNILLFPQTR